MTYFWSFGRIYPELDEQSESPVLLEAASFKGLISLNTGKSLSMALAAGSIFAWNHKDENNDLEKDSIKFKPMESPEELCFVSCARNSIYILSTSGRVYTMSLQDSPDVWQPISFPANILIRQIATGGGFALALDSRGRCYGWGNPSLARLGHHAVPTSTYSPEPGLIPGLADETMIAIACGWSHSMAISESGQLYTWGTIPHPLLLDPDNSNSIIGSDQFFTVPYPQKIDNFSENILVSVSCGYSHSLIMDAGGVVYAWGFNHFGQLGSSDISNDFLATPLKIQLPHIHSICCGAFHSAALTTSGELYCWGFNQYGQLGIGSKKKYASNPTLVEAISTMNISHIACGGDHTIAATKSFINMDNNYFETPSSPSSSGMPEDIALPIPIVFAETELKSPDQRRRKVSTSVSPSQPKRGFLSWFSPLTAPQLPFSRGELRPANLPPKDKIELLKQQKEIASMNKRYKEKMQRQLELENQVHRRHVNREARLAEAKKVWKKLLNNSPATVPLDINNRKIRSIVLSVGIPPSLRSGVWNRMIGNNLQITSELFEIYCQHAANAKLLKNQASEKKVSKSLFGVELILGKEATFMSIDIDLERTFPELAFFAKEGPMHDDLRTVLEAYCFSRPDIGYVQGMSYLAAHLLIYFQETLPTFICLANLLNSRFFHSFFRLEMKSVQEIFDIFSSLFEINLPKLFALFQSEGLTPDSYFLPFCLSLFTKQLSLDVVSRVWDCYFVLGVPFIYKVALAIFSLCESMLLGQSIDKIMDLIKSAPKSITEDDLFEAISDIKIPSKIAAKIDFLNSAL